MNSVDGKEGVQSCSIRQARRDIHSRDLLNVMVFTCDVGLGKRDPVQRTVVKQTRSPSAGHVKAPFFALLSDKVFGNSNNPLQRQT
jgi:hypothetical protein